MLTLLGYNLHAIERTTPYKYVIGSVDLFGGGLLFMFFILFIGMFLLVRRIKRTSLDLLKEKTEGSKSVRQFFLSRLNGDQVRRIIKYKKEQSSKSGFLWIAFFGGGSYLWPLHAIGQEPGIVSSDTVWQQAGVLITLCLLVIPVLAAVIFLSFKIGKHLRVLSQGVRIKEAEEIADYLEKVPLDEIETELEERLTAATYTIDANSLSGKQMAKDRRGLLDIKEKVGIPIVSAKKKALKRPGIADDLAKLIIWYIITATCWLVFGTTIGEYIGIKFVAPDIESLSWLSFGRLRPVHTNSVFWGWASLGMIGLAYYVVPRVSNTKIYNLKWGWCTLLLINLSVVLGTLSLMAGINNGGGEYREYVWPIMALFAIGLILTLINFYRTIGQRTTREIYISNWYIVSAIIFTIIITLVAYLPFWQTGLGETIVQGYYMHQGVGMWFMLFTLGLVYYFLPQQLNKPIYSYSLGILAFWTQILFYTLIGSHHFVFSSIPWWLQTVAIVGSAGMVIPVIAGTTNFLMTFKGSWYKIHDSYTLPFFLVGIIFYFTGSLQGTAEAFRSTNLIWHFTDFTVAHSHLTMYGIICFLLWACIYAVMPRVTGHEAPQITIGAHFWLAFIGMLFYTVPLMYGSTLKGLMWVEGKPFIEGVVMMGPYWLWRAIGGSLMWLSHIFFAYNIYKMITKTKEVDIQEEAVERLEQKLETYKIYKKD